MEAVDSSMTVMDDVDAVSMDSVVTSATGTQETVNRLDHVDNAKGIGAKDEDVTGRSKCTHPMNVTITDSVRDGIENADTAGTEDSVDSADLRNSRSMEIDDLVDSMDQSAKDGSNSCESDGDSSNEGTCLEAMTPYGQDFYLRLGDTPRRRSALRLSRIIARQQLLRRLAQGRNIELWQSDDMSVSY